MSVRARLTGAFVLVALLGPAMVALLLLREARTEFRQDYDARVARVRSGVGVRVDALVAELGHTIDRVATDSGLRELDQDLAHGVLRREPRRAREAQQLAGRLMGAPGLDLLVFVDGGDGGRVIALGHRLGVSDDDPQAAAAPDRPLLRMADFEQGGALVSRPTVQLARRTGERLVLLGGRILDDAALADLVAVAGVEARVVLLDADGGVLSGEGAPAGEAGWERTEVAIGDGGPFRLRVEVSTGALAERERALIGVTSSVGLLAAAVALLLGALLTRRITRPLAALAEAARRVTDGELDVPMPRVRRRDEIGRLVDAFDTMTRARQVTLERAVRAERIAAWKDMARRIAHEIKNPLFPIQTSIETLQKARARAHPDFEEIFDESTTTILEEVERMKRIVTEFSRFARLPAPDPHELDVAALVAQVARLYGGIDERVAVTSEAGPCPSVRADGELLQQVLGNFVQNAIDAVAERGGGRVVVGVAAAGDAHVEMTVDDDGPGVPPSDRARVFEPYFTRKDHGTGLGLAIAQRIVTDHGGAVRVEESPLGGARFVARLPIDGPDDAPRFGLE